MPHTTRAETAARRSSVVIMAAIIVLVSVPPRPVYTSTIESIRSSGMISPVFFAPALIALYSSVARRTRLPS